MLVILCCASGSGRFIFLKKNCLGKALNESAKTMFSPDCSFFYHYGLVGEVKKERRSTLGNQEFFEQTLSQERTRSETKNRELKSFPFFLIQQAQEKNYTPSKQVLEDFHSYMEVLR